MASLCYGGDVVIGHYEKNTTVQMQIKELLENLEKEPAIVDAKLYLTSDTTKGFQYTKKSAATAVNFFNKQFKTTVFNTTSGVSQAPFTIRNKENKGYSFSITEFSFNQCHELEKAYRRVSDRRKQRGTEKIYYFNSKVLESYTYLKQGNSLIFLTYTGAHDSLSTHILKSLPQLIEKEKACTPIN